MKKYAFLLLSAGMLFASCGEYQSLLKSDDAELKYNKAVEYFEKKDYMRASTLLDMVSTYYKGTDRSEMVLYYMAKSYVGQKDYYSASEYFKTYVKTFPKGTHVAEAKFMIGYCFYMDSPDSRLDQTTTYQAMTAFQEFLDMFPESERVPEANKLIDELTNKLALKAYSNAKLYFNLGDYLGNNYESCVITAQNALKKFPTTVYREELAMLVLQSKYEQASHSVFEKKVERYRTAIDEYYNFINEFPEGKFRKQADKILAESKKVVKE